MKYAFASHSCQYNALYCTNLLGTLGCSDFWWCTCELHWGRVGFAGSFPEESLQRCDVGNLPEP